MCSTPRGYYSVLLLEVGCVLLLTIEYVLLQQVECEIVKCCAITMEI
jgi:hypothetical protein